MSKGSHGKKAADSAAAQATVRLGPLASIPVVLQELGYQPEPILNSVGFDLSQFDNPDNKVSFIQTSKMIERCVKETGCDHFGLLLGTKVDPSSLGIAGFMLKVAPDVRTALQCLIRHLDLHDEGGHVTLDTKDDLSTLEYRIHISGVHAVNQVYDLSIVIATKILSALCGDRWKPRKILVSRPPPRNKSVYRKIFQAPVRFAADQTAVLFPTHWLDHKLPGADPFLFDYLERRAAELHRQQTDDLIDRLHQFISSSLSDRRCSVKNAALSLGMHQRTLERNLKERGTTFSIERDNLRFEMAKELLADTKASNKQVASVLGYSDATAFVRSFKQWSGTTPKRWRMEQ